MSNLGMIFLLLIVSFGIVGGLVLWDDARHTEK